MNGVIFEAATAAAAAAAAASTTVGDENDFVFVADLFQEIYEM